MATTDLERLVVQLAADTKAFQNEMQKQVGLTNKRAAEIERRFAMMNKTVAASGQSAARALAVPLAAVGASLGVREVAAYADAWTKAKNSLAVAGVIGTQQAVVLDQIYQSAQKNAAPVSALADLFGKAAQAGQELGASQADLLKFTDGVAVSLRVAGKSSTEASGALQQLGQLLGSARVQAEEFNSINEGARPILQAVAAGLDAAGGSVSKLKTLVNDGKVSNQDFFRAFLKGLPQIEAMAGNATQTLEQGFTKVENALTRYIGQQNQALGATTVLNRALNALANDFDGTADKVLAFAAIIAAALVGRSIAGMIVGLGNATIAVSSFTKAIVAARSVAGASAAIGTLGSVAGPLGAVLGVAAAAALYFAASSSKSGLSAENAAQLTERYNQALERTKKSAKDAGDAVAGAGDKFVETAKNNLGQQLKAAEKNAADAQKSLQETIRNTISATGTAAQVNPEQRQELVKLRGEIGTTAEDAEKFRDRLAAFSNIDPDFQRVFNKLKGVVDELIATRRTAEETAKALDDVGKKPAARFDDVDTQDLSATRALIKEERRRAALSKEQEKREKTIAAVKKEALALPTPVRLSDAEAADVADIRLAGEKAREDAERASKAASKPLKVTSESRFDQDIREIDDRAAAIRAETAALGDNELAQEKSRIATEQKQRTLREMQEEARRNRQAIARALPKEMSDQIDDAAQREAEASQAQRIARSLQGLKDRTQSIRDQIEVEKAGTAAGRERSLMLEAQREAEREGTTVAQARIDAIREQAQAEADLAYAQQARAADDRIADLDAELEVLRLGTNATREQVIATRELAKARREAKDGILRPGQEDEIKTRAALEASRERERDQIMETRDLYRELESAGADALTSILNKSQTATQAGLRLLQVLGEAVLKSALIGEGSLGKSLGGGLLNILGSAIVSGLSGSVSGAGNATVGVATGNYGDAGLDFAGFIPRRAAGGPVTAGQPYIVGEHRPELFVPGTSGRIIPRLPDMAAMASARRPDVKLQQNFHIAANGDEAIMRMVRSEVGRSRAETVKAINAGYPQRQAALERNGR